jgi:hypothetical protein
LIKTNYKKIRCFIARNYFYIICFYQNQNYQYIIIAFDYNLNEKTKFIIYEGYSDEGYENWFFKCVHFFDETGIFGYFDKNRVFTFQFKRYFDNNNTIANHYSKIEQFKLDNYFFNQNKATFCDMIKIEDKKIYFVGVSYNQEILIIVNIEIYYEENFSIRIYTINTKNLYNYVFAGDIRISIYNNFLTIASNYLNFTNYLIYSSLMLFGYPNTDEANLDLINYLYYNNDIRINNLELELKGNYTMENNIFGYEFSGIGIVDNCEELENIYLSDLYNQKILNNYYLSKNNKLKLKIMLHSHANLHILLLLLNQNSQNIINIQKNTMILENLIKMIYILN